MASKKLNIRGRGGGVGIRQRNDGRVTDNQVYPSLSTFKANLTDRLTFQFPYPPVNIDYSNLSPNWVEVARQGLVPFVGLQDYRLMRVQFEFLVAAPFDGIEYDIDEQLSLLREIANSTNPVYFKEMDGVISNPFPLPGTERTSNSSMFFRVVDFTISALRRNTSNKITAAQCTMVLQEDYAFQFTAIQMPEIEYPTILKPRPPAVVPPDDDDDDERCLASDVINDQCQPNYGGFYSVYQARALEYGVEPAPFDFDIGEFDLGGFG